MAADMGKDTTDLQNKYRRIIRTDGWEGKMISRRDTTIQTREDVRKSSMDIQEISRVTRQESFDSKDVLPT